MAYNILIVDDNENNRFTLKSVLDRLEVDLIEAKNGSETLEYLMKHSINLIILDIQLPDYSGFEIAQMIKARKSTMAIPIIFATAVFKSEEFVLKGYELGAIDYILKPFNVEMILAKVSYYISIEKERLSLIDDLESKNKELQESVEKLQVTQNLLSESVENWRLLGENVPYIIELYDYSGKLIFRNNIEHDDKVTLLHKTHFQDIEKQIKRTLNTGSYQLMTYQIDWEEAVVFFDVKGIYIHHANYPRIMLIINDVTVEKEHIDGIAYIGYHDHLTGLWNRHYFTDFLSGFNIDKAIPLTVMMADVNGLKLINDGFGHTAGDELIKAAAKVLTECAGEDAVIARWGGDEFLILLANTSPEMSREITNRITMRMEGEMIAEKFPVSIALGAVSCLQADCTVEHLIKEAEDKMYVNKMQNQSSYRSFIVESLKGALFEQDYETKEHTERISHMALIVAEHLEMSQNERDKLVLLGSLHDIGKIGIASSVLNNSGHLSDIDWNIIKRHPEIGYRICVSVPELTSIADLILSHHERWDGTGYPRKLKGSEIPLLARLIAILDTFDVITHNRPYRRKKSHEWALKEIKRCSGTQFDPNLVKVFEHVYMELIESGQGFNF